VVRHAIGHVRSLGSTKGAQKDAFLQNCHKCMSAPRPPVLVFDLRLAGHALLHVAWRTVPASLVLIRTLGKSEGDEANPPNSSKTSAITRAGTRIVRCVVFLHLSDVCLHELGGLVIGTSERSLISSRRAPAAFDKMLPVVEATYRWPARRPTPSADLQHPAGRDLP
jgi:hypothetical protein